MKLKNLLAIPLFLNFKFAVEVTISHLYLQFDETDFAYQSSSIGFELGIQRIQEKLIPFNITLQKAYAYADTSLKTLQQAVLLTVLNPNLICSIGQARTSLSYEQAAFFSSLPRPIISISPTTGGPSLDNKANMPYFFRTAPVNQIELRAISTFILQYWTHIGVLYCESIYPVDHFEYPIVVQEAVSIHDYDSGAEIFEGLRKMKDSGIKIIFAGLFKMQYKFLHQAASELGMLNDEFVFIGTNNYIPTEFSFFGLIYNGNFMETENPTEEYKYITDKWKTQVTKDPSSKLWDSRNETQGFGIATWDGFYTYDAVLGFGSALIHSLKQNNSPLNTTIIAEYLRNSTYVGSALTTMGYNSNQDAIAQFIFYQQVGEAEGRKFGFYNATADRFQFNDSSSIYFGTSKNASKFPPSDGSLPTATRTIATGTGISQAYAGKANNVIVTVQNSFNKKVVSNISVTDFEFHVERNDDSSESTFTEYNASMDATGNLLLNYSIPTFGSYKLSIFFQGASIIGSPFLINGLIECEPSCSSTGFCQIDGRCACQLGYTGEACSEIFPIATAGLDTNTGALIFIIALVNLALILIAICMIYTFRKKKAIMATSFVFTMLTGFGLFIWGLHPIFSTLNYTTFIPCWVAPACFHLGFTLAFVTLNLKNLRIILIFQFAMRFKRTKRFTIHLYVTAAVVIVGLILLLWQIFDPTTQQIISYSDGRVLECIDTSNNWQILLYSLEIAVLVFNSFISFKSRRLEDIYSESKSIAATTYIVFLLILINIFMFDYDLPYMTRYKINAFIHIFSPLISTVILLGWKIFNIFSDTEINKKKIESSNYIMSFSSSIPSMFGKPKNNTDFELRGKLIGLAGIFNTTIRNILVTVNIRNKVVVLISEKQEYCWAVNVKDLKFSKFWVKVLEDNYIKGVIFSGKSSSFWLEGNPETLENLGILLHSMVNEKITDHAWNATSIKEVDTEDIDA